MTKNQILESLKLGFKRMLFAGETSQVTTTDGKTIIAYGEDIMVGCEAYLLNSDNTQSPLENGDYMLQDGRTITVTDNNITEIKEPEAPAAIESPEINATNLSEYVKEDMPEDNKEEKLESETEARISALENTVEEMMKMLQDYLNESAEMKQEQVKMSEKIKKIADQPAGEKPKVSKKMYGESISNMDEIRQLQKKLFNK